MRFFSLLSAIAFCALQPGAEALADERESNRRLIAQAMPIVCSGRLNRPPVAGARPKGRDQFRVRGGQARAVVWKLGSGNYMHVTRIRSKRGMMTFADLYAEKNRKRPLIRGVVNGQCRIMGGREMNYGTGASAQSINHLAPDLQNVVREIPLNPPIPSGPFKQCLRIGVLDNGVNYNLPEIAGRIARTKSGKPVAYDVWDDDDRPFDFGVPPNSKDPRRSAFSPNHHGTMVASALLDFAPQNACIVPVRYPPFADSGEVLRAADYFAKAGVKIVSLQSSRKAKWPDFREAMRKHPQILFVAAAGNDGKDLNSHRQFPLAYDSPNLLVVGGSGLDGQRWKRSNYGRDIVDVYVRSEEVRVTRFTGKTARLSGTSFAAPKLAGYAGRLLTQNPQLSGAELHDLIVKRAKAKGPQIDGTPALTDEELAGR